MRRRVPPVSENCSKGAPGHTRPAIFAFNLSKASALRLHQRNVTEPNPENPNPKNQNPLEKILTRGFRISADFFGASPVASALDLRLGRDPDTDRIYLITPSSLPPSKQDLSTLQRIGHFYFALTGLYGQVRGLPGQA